MNDDTIFLLRGSTLTELRQAPYAQEAVLQKALATFPEVIAGPTTVEGATAGLLLIKQEMGVPKVDGGSAVFRLDHLFIDAEGVPVLVEVKRSSDTRIRREVVGQMLDYVANAVAYWKVSDLAAALEASTSGAGGSSADLITRTTGLSAEEFWQLVEANLRTGRVRLLFVADILPPELVRVIEFLNEQMSPAEVLGVELRQYVGDGDGDGHTVLVPRVVGRTSAAVATKVRAAGMGFWNRETFLDYATTTTGAAQLNFLRLLLEDAESRGTRLAWGNGESASVGGWEVVAGRPTRVWMIQLGSIRPNDVARLELEFKRLTESLTDVEPGLNRLDRAAKILGQIPAAVDRLDAARAVGWRVGKRFPLSEVAGNPTDTEYVLSAIRELTASGS